MVELIGNPSNIGKTRLYAYDKREWQENIRISVISISHTEHAHWTVKTGLYGHGMFESATHCLRQRSCVFEWRCVCVFFTLCPGGRPGSHTAAETRRTSRCWSCAALGPRLSSPACSICRVGNSVLPNPSTFPKQRKNCITIRQSAKQLPGRSSPGNLDSSGRAYKGWEGVRKAEYHFSRHLPTHTRETKQTATAIDTAVVSLPWKAIVLTATCSKASNICRNLILPTLEFSRGQISNLKRLCGSCWFKCLSLQGDLTRGIIRNAECF